MKVTFGMSEIFLIGSIALYQFAFWFSIILLCFALIGKLLDFGAAAREKKEAEENNNQLMKNFTETVSSAITLGNIMNGKDQNGFH